MRKLLIFVVPLTVILTFCSKEQKVDKDKSDEGLTLLQKGEYQSALETFAVVDSVNPGSPYGVFGKAVSQAREGLTLEAINSLILLTQKHSKFDEAFRLLSELQSLEKRHDQAIYSAGKYAALVGENQVASDLMSRALISAGQLSKAGELIEKTVNKGTMQPLFLLTAARYYFLTGNHDRSNKFLGQALADKSDDPRIFLGAGSLHALNGKTDSAASYFARAASSPRSDFYFKADAADSLISIKYLWKAGQIINDIQKINGGSQRVIALKSHMMERMGKDFNAHLIYGDATAAYPNSPTVLTNFGRSMLSIYHVLGAEAYMTNALSIAETEKYPPEDQAFMMLTQLEILWERRQVGQSMAALQPLLELMPGEFRILDIGASYSRKYAPPDESREIVRSFERLADGNPYRLSRVGDFYSGIDSLREARQYYDAALKLAPNYYPAIKGLIGILKKAERLERILEFLAQLPEFVSFYPEFAVEKLAAMRQLKKYPEALAFAEAFIDAGPEDLSRYRLAIAIADEAGDQVKAQSLVDFCLQKNGEDPEAYVITGDFQLRHDRTADAEKQVEKALALDTLCVNAYLLQARADTAAGRNAEAIELYEKIIQLDQFSAEAFNNLAWLLLKTDGDPRMATNHASAAISYDAFNGLYYNTLGWSYYKQNRYDFARGAFERGLNLAPDNPILNFYAGLNYVKDKKPDKAKTHLLNSLSGNLPAALRREAEENLKKL